MLEDPFPQIVALTGLAFEGGLAGCQTIISDGNKTSGLLQDAIACGARGIISFGVCGGLSPSLKAGQWVVASSVLDGEVERPTHEGWAHELAGALPGCARGLIAGVERPLSSPVDKAKFHFVTGAIAVDMESHIAARVAASHGLPFASCRVVIDAAHRTLPPAALLNLRPGASIDFSAVLHSLLKEPSQIAGVIRLAADAALAISALRRSRPLLRAALRYGSSAKI